MTQEPRMHCEECGHYFDLSEDCKWVAGSNTIVACPNCHATGPKSIVPAHETYSVSWLDKLYTLEDNR